MIRENQILLNRLNVLTDGVLLFLSLPIAFWIRFFVLPNGVPSVPLKNYLWLNLWLTLFQLAAFGLSGLYRSFRHTPMRRELPRLWRVNFFSMAILFSWLFIGRGTHYSRLTWAIFFLLSGILLTGKRIFLRLILQRLRKAGYNQKRVLLIGSGELAARYLEELHARPSLGYRPLGYIGQAGHILPGCPPRLGDIEDLETVLDRAAPDEVVSALEMEDFHHTTQVIACCEKAGVRLSIIPFYARYIPSSFQVDDLNGIPMMNLRRIPLDNVVNAFCKRLMDVVGSALLLILSAPVMLVCAVGVRLSSPGPVIFRQERVGLNKKPFYMYKFRSMRVNDSQNTAWSRSSDSRRTGFGAFLRKCSLDELPQLWNVLKGDMSLVGPRPELPCFVEQFKEDVPFYMVKHQVRPGITGWAQVNGFRGDTSIKGRIEHDIYYIEHWSFLFDLQILWMTVFGGKFLNQEALSIDLSRQPEEAALNGTKTKAEL